MDYPIMDISGIYEYSMKFEKKKDAAGTGSEDRTDVPHIYTTYT